MPHRASFEADGLDSFFLKAYQDKAAYSGFEVSWVKEIDFAETCQ
jgi:hypothetical protein